VDWAYLALFAARLSAARVLGFRIAWTIHQVYPHDRRPCLLDRLGARLLARAASVLIAHDRATAEQARAELGRAAADVFVVPHGSYEGVYVARRSREETRRALGVPAGRTMFLHLGDLRGYKDLGRLFAAFARADVSDAALVVAGTPEDDEAAARLQSAAERDARIVLHLTFVPEHQVAELYAAADVAVVARSDGGTSGSLILALSMGAPVVAADRPAYRELVGEERAGWLFQPERTDSLRDALERAGRATSAERTAKAEEAGRRAARLDWNEIGSTTAALFRAALKRRAA
jgi:glycosyltransferase involved in cell wall biosynthesis